VRARILLSGKSGTDAPQREAAASDLPPGPASRSGSQAEISRGACCASHVTHPTTPGGAVEGSCAGVPGPLGPDSVWELPRPQIGSHPSARRPRPIPGVTSFGPGTRVPGRSEPQSRSGSREYHPDPGRDRALGGPVILRIVPSPAHPARAERVCPRDTWLPEPRMGGMTRTAPWRG
jgi:hypothetical protein